MDWERAVRVADVFNKWALTVAVVVGGGWAFYTFSGELKRENAQAQLEKIQSEIAAMKRVSLKVKVTATPLKPIKDELMVEVRVALHNDGTVDLDGIDLAEKSLSLTPIAPTGPTSPPKFLTKKQVIGHRIFIDVNAYPAAVASVRIPANTSDELHYIAQVPKPGRYLVAFSVQSKEADGKKTKSDSAWSGSQILDVRGESAGSAERAGVAKARTS